MLSESLLRSLGISESDAPYLNLERDWDIKELPDSTPENPSFSIWGEVACRPLATDPQQRCMWVREPRERAAAVGDVFVMFALQQPRMAAEECILKSGSNEEYLNTPIKVTSTGEDGKPTVTDRARRPEECMAYTLVICDTPLDALCAHTTLAVWARRRAESKQTERVGQYLHFCCLSDQRRFSRPIKRLQSVAQTLIVSPGTGFMACQRQFAICNRYSSVLFHSMPVLADDIVTLHDFILRYRLSTEERVKYQGSKASMLFDLMTAALSIDPFLKTESIDKKTGEVKDYNYQLQIRSAWLLMQSRGYVRVIDPRQPDKVGRYYKVTGNIVDEVNRESLMAKCLEVLTDYARSKAVFGTQDFPKMAQAIRTAKTLSAATAADLPVITLDRRQGYNRHLDHFFFQNGALRITPTEIRLIPYDQLDFFVDAPAILPWEFDSSLLTPNSSLKELPFKLFENPEYKQRKDAIDAALTGPDRISPKEHARKLRELYDWARLNRWVFQPASPNWHEWCPFMQVIRCYANEEWEEEQELEYRGEQFSPEQQQFLTGRIVNILATIGRIVFRYRGVNFLHYIMENNVTSEGKAEGGSGKSFLINDFVACVRNVLPVDSKKLNARDDIETSVIFNAFRPGFHDVVHVEDYERDIKRFYNYVTGNFEFRKFHTNETRIESDEAPSIVITSNYAVRDGMDDSSAGRLNLCGISHFFHRENENLNLMQRGFDVVMPKFAKKPQDLDPRDRSDIILCCALAVQFVMGIQDKVLAPARNLKERNLRTSLGDSFFDWAEDFFSHPYNYRCPIDFQTIFQDFIELSDSSEDKQTKFSPKAFTQRLQQYCQNNDIAFMPEVAYRTNNDRLRHCMNLKAWCKVRYFDDPKIWGDRLKVVREMKTSRKAICFYPADQVPRTYKEVEADFIRYWDTPDPEPILDADGERVLVSEQERAEWQRFLDNRQGKPRGQSAPPADATVQPIQQGANSSFTQAPQQQQEELQIPQQFIDHYKNQQPQDPNLPF